MMTVFLYEYVNGSYVPVDVNAVEKIQVHSTSSPFFLGKPLKEWNVVLEELGCEKTSETKRSSLLESCSTNVADIVLVDERVQLRNLYREYGNKARLLSLW